jgi:hypothetical protein
VEFFFLISYLNSRHPSTIFPSYGAGTTAMKKHSAAHAAETTKGIKTLIPIGVVEQLF